MDILSSKTSYSIGIQASLADRTANPEILWMLKVAYAEYSLRSCDSITKMFHIMFNCDVTKNNDFSFGCNEVSYCFSDDLGPVFLKKLCLNGFTVLLDETTGFTVLLDETTNLQNKQQMDLLVRYWCEQNGEVITAYVTLMFGRCTHKLRDNFMSL